MKRITNISWWAYLTFQREYKIGIASSTRSRNSKVDKAIKGKVVVLSSRRLPAAYMIEQRLHKLFGGSRFTIKGKRGGGLTEWFYLNPWEYGVLELWLTYFEYLPQIRLCLAFLLVLFLSWINSIIYL